MIPTITYKFQDYPAFQAEGNASQFAIPYALHVCKGIGVDIGYCKEEWKFPGAIGVDINDSSVYHAMNLPQELDYIYSSHCLEHLPSWIDAITYWIKSLASKGTLFLYLPHYTQEYWLPWNNTKHKHILHKEDIIKLLSDLGMKKIYSSDIDLNNSFMIMCEKS